MIQVMDVIKAVILVGCCHVLMCRNTRATSNDLTLSSSRDDFEKTWLNGALTPILHQLAKQDEND